MAFSTLKGSQRLLIKGSRMEGPFGKTVPFYFRGRTILTLTLNDERRAPHGNAAFAEGRSNDQCLCGIRLMLHPVLRVVAVSTVSPALTADMARFSQCSFTSAALATLSSMAPL